MTNPLASIQSLSHAKALAFAGGILALFFFLSFLINIPATSISRITTLLNAAGFEQVKIGELSYSAGGLSAQSVTLDSYGFDKIGRLDVGLTWPTFLFGGKVDEVKISGLSLSRDASDIKTVLQKSLVSLLEPSDYRLALDNAVIDVKTPVGDLRFILNATIDPPDESGEQKINASIVANQYQLGFDSKWSGIVNKDGQLDLNADIVDGKMHFGPLMITRFNGWIALDAGKQALALQSQLNAGGAELFKVPMQDISLVTDLSTTASTMMFRSSMAGLKDVALSSDMSVSGDSHSFDITLKGENMGAFFKRIAAERKANTNVPDALNKNQPFRLVANYQADRRFAGGPLPFTLDGTRGSEKLISGNFLIYPDALDMRGSAEIDPAMTKGLQSFFDIKSEHMDGNFIRLDGDLDGLFKQPAPQSP